MRDNGPNVAATGANIGAYAKAKAVKQDPNKKSAENIVEIPLTVRGYKGQTSAKKVMYMEKGLGITFKDANGKETTYTIGQDGKIYDSNNRVVSSLQMDANQYAVLDAMSKEAREATRKKDGSDVNDQYDVLTGQDIREAEDNMHPYIDRFKARFNEPEAQAKTAGRVRGSISSAGGDKTVTLDIGGGHKNDVDSKDGTFTIKLVEGKTVTNREGHRYHPKGGSVSVFMKD